MSKINVILNFRISKINWTTVINGMVLQFLLALLIIKLKPGEELFNCLGNKVTTFLGYAVEGAAFVYGDDLVYKQGIFAFKVKNSFATIETGKIFVFTFCRAFAPYTSLVFASISFITMGPCRRLFQSLGSFSNFGLVLPHVKVSTVLPTFSWEW